VLALFVPPGDDLSFLWRRTLTHSVVGAPVLAALLALALGRLPSVSRLGFRTTYGLALLGVALHVLFDLANSYGVVLFYPLSLRRLELAWLYIIDLALWAALIVPLVLGAAVPRLRARGEMPARASVALVALYVAVAGAARAQAQARLERVAEAEGAAGGLLGVDLAYVFPEPLGPHRFRGVVRRGEEYRVYIVHPFTGDVEARGTERSELRQAAVKRARATERARRLEGFFKAPVWSVVRGPGGEPVAVLVRDLRFRSIAIPRRSAFEFRFPVSEEESP